MGGIVKIDVEKLAREAGVSLLFEPDRLAAKALVALVMEECAKVCDGLVYALDHAGNEYRREATASQCAAAIRARVPS
jgi:hypothetical protein